MDLVPIGVHAIAGRHEIDKGTGAFWQDGCLRINRINVIFGPFIVGQNRLQKTVIDGIVMQKIRKAGDAKTCLLYTSPSPRDLSTSRMPSSA